MRSARVTLTPIALAAGTLFLAIATWWFARDHWNTLYDDAFIYLRYARNLKNGCGLRFNCHDAAVEGFTSPLYLALLWLLGNFTGQLIELTQWLGMIAVVVSGTLAGIIVARGSEAAEVGKRATVIAVLASFAMLAFDHYVLLNANIGMETALAAVTCCGVGVAAFSKWKAGLVACATLAFLARPEGVLFLLALPLLPELRKPRYLVAALAVIVVVTVLRLALFGVPLPNTYYAKSGGTWRHFELGAAYCLQIVRDFPITLAAPLVLLSRSLRHEARYLLVVAAVWLVFFLRTGGDTFEYSRLWYPLVPLLVALGLVGGLELGRRFVPKWPEAFAAILATVLSIRAAMAHDIPPQATGERIVEWAATGTYLRSTYPRGTLVATVPIGAIGYYSSLPILDLVGLTDATIARSGRTVPAERLDKAWIGHERHATEYVLERKPSVIVTTMVRDQPWTTLAEARAGFWADWLLLQAIRMGQAHYHVRDAEIQPGVHLLMFEADQPR